MFVSPGELRLPFDSRTIFGREGPLIFEIGFGNGWFLEQLARADPSANVLGAETSASSVHRAYRRLSRARLDNVRMFKGDAVFLTRFVLRSGSIDTVYVNYPDPWPRRKHRGRRLLSADFLQLLADRLKPSGKVVLTTDHAEYFQFARDQAAKSTVFSELVATPPSQFLETRYAKKWRRQGKAIYHAVLTSRGHVADPVPDIGGNNMQHALLSGDLGTVGSMPPGVYRKQDAYVIVMNHLLDEANEGMVFAVHVEEHGLKQDILIEAVPREHGIFVGVRRFGSPMATRGVGEALRIVVDWLESRGLEVRDRWYRDDQPR